MKLHQGFSTPLVIAIMAFAVVSFLFLIDTAMNPDGSKKTTNTNKNTNQVACTLEAKICPDGSAVGRTGPNCEFAECPTTNTNTSSPATSDWKTYSNTEHQYSFKYPADLQPEPERNGGVTLFSQDQNRSIAVLVLNQHFEENKIERMNEEFVASADLTKVDVNGVTWYRFRDGYLSCSGTEYRTALDSNKTLKASFGRCEDGQNEYENNQDFQELVLSTFTFTDPTAGWKTYTNATLGFSIKTPPDWEVDTERTTVHEVVFLPNPGTESREAIKSTITNLTLAGWKNTLDQSSIVQTTTTTVAGETAMWVKTGSFSLNYIAFRHNDRLFVVTSNTKIIDLGILETFTFTD